MPQWAVLLELVWHVVVNAGTMYVFLWKERWGNDGVIRFMW